MDPKLKALLEDLEESVNGDVQAEQGSQAVITPDLDHPNKTQVLDDSACRKVFQSETTVRALFRALGCPDNASIELESVDVPCEAADTMEELFVDVQFN